MKTEEEMIEYVSGRIELIEKGELHESIPKKNGVLVHVIPQNMDGLIPFDIEDDKKNDRFEINYAFRSFSDLDAVFENNEVGIFSYIENRGFYSCFQNGIVETYRSPIAIPNQLAGGMQQIKVDNIFYQIRSTLDAAKAVHQKIFKSKPPYFVFITLIGVGGTYLYSIDKNYVITDAFPSNNGRFHPFQWNDMKDDIMPEIISSVHYGIRASSGWKK
jgi:hypothetical protein